MPDAKTIAPPKEASNKTSGAGDAVPSAKTAVPSDSSSANTVVAPKEIPVHENGTAASASTQAKSVAEPQSKPDFRSRLKKIVPVVVLALAALILFTVVGGWNRWVGSSATQRTDDAILRSDITPL